jgi:hypothetical protein
MLMSPQLRVAELTREESTALLARNHLGRLAFTFYERVDIEPVGYTYEDHWLYGRTSPGAKIFTVKHHPWVALQVDEIQSAVDWESVVVHGTFQILDPLRSTTDRVVYERAFQIIRAEDPTAFTDEDFAPHRSVIFRIHVDEIVGRRGALENAH